MEGNILEEPREPKLPRTPAERGECQNKVFVAPHAHAHDPTLAIVLPM